jgi:type II secretory pathway pseudopilin PulG
MKTSRERGTSMVEVAVVVALIAIVLAYAVINTSTTVPNYKASIAMNSVYSTLRSARQIAISQHRNVIVAFTSDPTNQYDEIVLSFNDRFGTSTIGTYPWEGGARFHTFGLPDTPMQFCTSMGSNCTCGSGDAICFNGTPGGPKIMEFTPTGAFVDGTTLGENPSAALNGTVYLGILPQGTGVAPAQWVYTARAVTVLGATGRVRQYRWDGTNWRE